jgi:hypothetical protein
MEKINYAYIANNLLGNDLYCKFIKEIAKENKGENLVDYGKEIFEKCCLLIMSLGMSNVVKMDKIKICVGNEIMEVSCKKFALKYEKYVSKIEKGIIETL